MAAIGTRPESPRGAGTLEVPELKAREFAQICELAYSRFGLSLRDGKERLVSSRLGKLIRKGGFRSFDEYYQHVISDRSGEALVGMIDSLTTNHTSFLREPEHFRFLTQAVAPELRRRSQVRIWSAASSTGEEPYSILFTLLDVFAAGGGPAVEVLATDISTRVLAIGRAGVYPAERAATLPPEMLGRYLVKGHGPAEGSYRVRPEVAARVRFERLNLMDPLPQGPKYPVIFCRNVMIYFDRDTRADLVRRLSQCLEPGGYLFVGHAESLIGAEHDLTYIRPAIYCKPAPERRR